MSTEGGYEAHITFELELFKKLVDLYKPVDGMVNIGSHATERPWKVSRIDGDPVLGQKVYGYLTDYGSDETVMLERIGRAVSLCRGIGCPPIRAKLEKIVYDKRFG